MEADTAESGPVKESAEALGEVGGSSGLPVRVVTTNPLSVHRVPATWRSSCWRFRWPFSELTDSVVRAMWRSEARVLTVGMLLTPEFTDQERTQIATDRDTGESLYTVTVFVMEDDRADTIKVTVPKSGLPNGRNVGTFEEQSLAQPPGAKNRSSGGSLTLWSAGELFRVSLLDQGRPADAGRRAPHGRRPPPAPVCRPAGDGHRPLGAQSPGA